ncbi:MAG: pimeloyl-ACP methyl ester esterase BioH [Methylococcales bacterium]
MSSHLHIEIYGQGKTVVLLHGWAMHTGVWRDFAIQLAQQARVICIDLPGHGRSISQHPFELQLIAAQLVEALDEAPCYWLGWSLGALVALEIVRQYPEKVRGLILLAGTPCFVKKINWAGMDRALLEKFADNLLANPQATVIHFLAIQIYGLEESKQFSRALTTRVAECAAPNPEVLQAGLMILKNQDLRPALVSIHCPVLTILGKRDALVPVGVAVHLQQLLESLQVVTLDKAGHVPFLSHADETTWIVIDFLNAT